MSISKQYQPRKGILQLKLKIVEFKVYFKVSVVTADGSVDCMKDPGEQERFVEHLHFCETMTALAVLQSGNIFYNEP